MATKKRSAGKGRTGTGKRRTGYKRRRRSSRSLGLLGLSAPKDIKGDVLDIAAAAAGIFAAAKGAAIIGNKIAGEDGSKPKQMIAPGALAAAGVAGAMLINDRFGKALAKGVAIGGALKLAEKALGKENLLSGLDDDDDGNRPVMIPGIGYVGQAALPEGSDVPELSQYSENPAASATATGGSYEYHMGPPASEVLSGDNDLIAY